jgi:hypothetical protein
MIGAIAGDIIGSVYEGKKHWLAVRTADFQPLFSLRVRLTDDTAARQSGVPIWRRRA